LFFDRIVEVPRIKEQTHEHSQIPFYLVFSCFYALVCPVLACSKLTHRCVRREGVLGLEKQKE